MPAIGGWAGWVMRRVSRISKPRARLELLERITLAPRQTLAMIEADGRRFLVATSAEGSPAFLSLEGGSGRGAGAGRRRKSPMRRVSW
jgi:Flagellar biosynthesis protein, FliO